MRKERIAMVQNEQQYICIHECLLNSLEGKEDLHIEPQLLDNPGFDGKLSPPSAVLFFSAEFQSR